MVIGKCALIKTDSVVLRELLYTIDQLKNFGLCMALSNRSQAHDLKVGTRNSVVEMQAHYQKM